MPSRSEIALNREAEACAEGSANEDRECVDHDRVRRFISGAARRQLDSTRFSGHLSVTQRGIQDVEDKTEIQR